MNFKSKFDPNSERALRGLAFQNLVQQSIESRYQKTKNIRDWLLEKDSCLTEIQLNTLEHTWGDIVIVDKVLPYPVFVECVSLKGEKSIFPNHKIKKFSGENKYYCFGWEDEMRFVRSVTWNSYMRKCESFEYYTSFSRRNVKSLRNQYHNVDAFCSSLAKL